MNIFSVLALRDEKYHNRMLAWLLDPEGSHELGSKFLSEFLSLVEVNHNPEEFVQIEAEYTIFAPNNLKARRPDIYLQTDGYHIFIENKVRRTSINDLELLDQAVYIRNQGYDPAIHIFIVPLLKDIPSSTQAIIEQNDIHKVQWSALTKISDEIIERENVDSDVRTILEQYSIYLKEHVMKEFMGFNVEEMQQYVELSESFAKFKGLEKQAGTQIQAFLSVVGEEIQDKFTKLTGQDDWQTEEIKNYAQTINWGLYLTRLQYQNLAFFGVWLSYVPPKQGDQMLHASVSLKTDKRLVDIIRQRFEGVKAQGSINREWGEGSIGKDFYQFWEDWQLPWRHVKNWQDTKNYLVERTVEWMKEFTPILEEQVIAGNFS